MQITT